MPQGLHLFVKSAVGQKIVIEFKDESAVWGPVEDCDESMNISLGQSLYFKRRIRTGPPLELNQFFARNRYIRFIHLDVSPSVLKRYSFDQGKEPLRRLSHYLSDYSLIEPRLRSLYSSNDTKRSHLSFKAFGEDFDIILDELDRPPGLHGNFKLLDSDENDRSMNYSPNIKHYEASFGHNLVPIGSFSIDGDNGSIMGHFDTEYETFFIEQVNSNETVIYKASDVKYSAIKNQLDKSLFVPECPKKVSVFDVLKRKKRAIQILPVKKNRCEMKLVADYEFFKVIGNNNYYSAARHLINVVERVNKLFTAVDFGLNRDNERMINLGLVIKEIKIYDKPFTDSRNEFHFNMEYPMGSGKIFSADDILYSFSKEEEGKSACVSVLLTAKIFADSVLGLANIGHLQPRMGVCADELKGKLYANTAIVTVKKQEGLMITRIFDLVFAHELGHLWGSGHDGDECVAENYSSGRFIMHSSSNTGYDSNNYRFSNCSINSIFKILHNIQPDCFVEEQKSLCGNGILEPGEECDSGGRYADGEDIHRNDSCCTSNCKLKAGAKCSPRHSDCCSDKCDYLPRDHICVMRNDDTCRDESYCTGRSPYCPEPPYAKDGTTCSDQGTCRSGDCISFCEMTNRNHLPCICENLSDSCYRCCKDGKNGKCFSVSPRIPLRDGSICILGSCKNKVCEKDVTDVATHFWKIIKTPGSKLFGDYAVFLIVFISLIIWIPCSIFVCQRDKKTIDEQPEEGEVEYALGLKKIHRQNGTEPQKHTGRNHIESTA